MGRGWQVPPPASQRQLCCNSDIYPKTQQSSRVQVRQGQEFLPVWAGDRLVVSCSTFKATSY